MQNRSIFFSNCFHHKKHYDRMDAMQSAGFNITLVGYDWSYGVRDADKRGFTVSKQINLIRIDSSNSRRRVYAILRNIIVLRYSLRCEYSFDIAICNSLEMLLLFMFSGLKAKRVIFDLADLNPWQFQPGILTKILNFLERRFSKSGVEYVVTSPWFFTDFIAKRIDENAKCYLIENFIALPKTRVEEVSIRNELNYDVEDGVCILWNGILRCNQSLIYLEALVNSNESIRLNLAGDVNGLDGALLKRVMQNSRIKYFGMYKEESLFELYKENHWIWATDLNEDLNSKLLLPNRVYQSIFGALPCISVGDTAISKFVSAMKIGLVQHRPSPRDLAECLLDFEKNQYFEIKKHLRALRDNATRGNEWIDLLALNKGLIVNKYTKPEEILLRGCMNDSK